MIRQWCERLITSSGPVFCVAGIALGVVPERLLFYRTHPSGVTHADPRGTFLEMGFATLRNLVPMIERLAAWPSLSRIIEAWIGYPVFAALRPLERYRLLGMLLADPPVGDFTAFRRAITDRMGQHPDLALVTAGRPIARAGQPHSEHRAKIECGYHCIRRSTGLLATVKPKMGGSRTGSRRTGSCCVAGIAVPGRGSQPARPDPSKHDVEGNLPVAPAGLQSPGSGTAPPPCYEIGVVVDAARASITAARGYGAAACGHAGHSGRIDTSRRRATARLSAWEFG
jgi:hypothetical protein